MQAFDTGRPTAATGWLTAATGRLKTASVFAAALSPRGLGGTRSRPVSHK